MSGTVTWQLAPDQQRVAWVTLENEGKFNAMSRTMWRDLQSAFEQIGARTDVRVVVVQGKGGHFCSGGDISEYPSFRFDTEKLRNFHEVEVWCALQSLLACDVPVIAGIEGNCMGAGLEIACCCDLRLAGATARFGAPIARLGFPMAPREAALVAKGVGTAVARAMLLAAEVLDAPALHAQGFLTQVVHDGHCGEQARAMAVRISTLSPQATRLNKQALRRLDALLGPHSQALWVESVQNQDTFLYADSAEHREGIAAFLEKRSPHF
ncbi:MAG: enoyl-CoA hydratase/isomerase family protein [Rhodoferax sp.]|nr:enoyl-CoA hydratase/isomerase family protein [Rhodoferax sp.]MCF8210262.1 enoyl-CoA hydratase/isomerase family protein [Rhodoferax sp.]